MAVGSKKMTLAFLYNIRHRYPDPENPRTHLEADFDDPETIAMMIRHLERLYGEILAIEANETAYFKLYRHRQKIDLVFNYAEGIYGQDREAQLPAILEMLQIPYSGSRPLTQALVLHKAKTKEILAYYQVPVLPHQIMITANDSLSKGLVFPLIVKPIAQGSSAGITNESVVFNRQQLRQRVAFVLKTFKQAALVEPFLTGREFSVAMLGNPPQILPMIEADHSKLPKHLYPLDSLEVKWIYEENIGSEHLLCPAKLKPKLKAQIEKICRQTWSALQIRDWCRLDIRCHADGRPFVLEVNSPPGCIPPEISTTSYFPLAARTAGISYPELLKEILGTAQKRYGLTLTSR